MKDFTIEQIKAFVKKAYSFNDLFKTYMGYKGTNTKMRAEMSQILKDNSIDYSHFSSNSSLRLVKYPKIEKICPQCNIKFYAYKGCPKRDSTTCSHKCSNLYFSHKRRKKDTNLKISQSMQAYHELKSGIKYKIFECPVCGKEIKQFKKTKITCSKKCSNFHRHGAYPLTEKQVLEEIHKLAKKGDYQKRKASGNVLKGAIRFFKTWNKAVQAAGYKPNEQKMTKKAIKTLDDHIVHSFSEKTIDDFLFKKSLNHEIQKNYPGDNKWTCDFYLIDYKVWVEFFGLYHEYEEYKLKAEDKKQFCKENNMKLIEIYPEDLYPQNKLKKIFKQYDPFE